MKRLLSGVGAKAGEDFPAKEMHLEAYCKDNLFGGTDGFS